MSTSPKTMNEILRNLDTVQFGIESTVYQFNFGAKIWELIPENIKYSESVDIFKSKIRKWGPEICPCRLCKTYVNQVGFVN